MKLDKILTINEDVMRELINQKIHRNMNTLIIPKWVAIFIGVPYVLFLSTITLLAFVSGAYLVALGFGCISLLMVSLLIHYFYQLHLVKEVKASRGVLFTQKQLAYLRLSSLNSISLVVFQLPFWSVCWMSMDALKESPFVYGGVHLLVFISLSLISFWLYKELKYENPNSKVRDFFLSGREWDPIQKSVDILAEIKGYKNL